MIGDRKLKKLRDDMAEKYRYSEAPTMEAFQQGFDAAVELMKKEIGKEIVAYEELEKKLADLGKSDTYWRRETELSWDEFATLKEKNRKLAEALRFYADPNNWFDPRDQEIQCKNTIYQDLEDVTNVSPEKRELSGGKRARKVLKKVGAE